MASARPHLVRPVLVSVVHAEAGRASGQRALRAQESRPGMNRRAATAIAIAATLVVYALVAWTVRDVAIPSDVSTAQAPWIRPFRVVATLGFVFATRIHVPHAAGEFLAAIALGGVLGAVFAFSRHSLQ